MRYESAMARAHVMTHAIITILTYFMFYFYNQINDILHIFAHFWIPLILRELT